MTAVKKGSAEARAPGPAKEETLDKKLDNLENKGTSSCQ